jgi:transcriptional regulator GlxA family with amidase domain
LYRLFERRHQTVMAHVQEARLQRSHAMLSDPSCNLQIAEVGFLCGFSDPSVFSRSFRQRFGCLPRDVRQKAAIRI